ncbi:cysteine hydrolase [Burkholderia savannae]|uniref:cysteine hydrolase family protein n=1 Tax=Burkholderia savannae TaxID=1637837 RepID=UPI000759EE8F|nr:isochorismatase family cysteine hydrolase [Burkholderia savannae]AOJ84825.1 cysteine hydrolase [Burkholderia savannae]
MSQTLALDPKTSALLLMDFQGFVLDNFVTPAAAADVVSHASTLLASARAADVLTIHVAVTFRPGYPEICPHNKLFSRLKDSGLVAPGGDGAKIYANLAPRDLEPVIAKHRVGAFMATDLERLLRANGITTLVLAGVTTGGVVLSTVRQAFDLDYELVVASDGCTDPDEQVHTVLIEKVLSQHATIASTAEIAGALKQ